MYGPRRRLQHNWSSLHYVMTHMAQMLTCLATHRVMAAAVDMQVCLGRCQTAYGNEYLSNYRLATVMSSMTVTTTYLASIAALEVSSVLAFDLDSWGSLQGLDTPSTDHQSASCSSTRQTEHQSKPHPSAANAGQGTEQHNTGSQTRCTVSAMPDVADSLAALTGRHCAHFQADAESSLHCLQQWLIGVTAAGSWGCLSGLEHLQAGTVSVVSQWLCQMQQAWLTRCSVIQIGSQSVRVDCSSAQQTISPYAVFVHVPDNTASQPKRAFALDMQPQGSISLCDQVSGSTNHQSAARHATARTKVLQAVSQCSRAVAIHAPPLSLVTEAYFRGLGLKECSAASKALVSILKASSLLEHHDAALPRYGLPAVQLLLQYIAKTWTPAHGTGCLAIHAVQDAVDALLLPRLQQQNRGSVQLIIKQAVASCLKSVTDTEAVFPPACSVSGAGSAMTGSMSNAINSNDTYIGARGVLSPTELELHSLTVDSIKSALLQALSTSKPSTLREVLCELRNSCSEEPSLHQQTSLPALNSSTALDRVSCTTRTLDVPSVIDVCCLLHTSLRVKGSCLLVGPPGIGKTIAWQQLLRAYQLLGAHIAPNAVRMYPTALLTSCRATSGVAEGKLSRCRELMLRLWQQGTGAEEKPPSYAEMSMRASYSAGGGPSLRTTMSCNSMRSPSPEPPTQDVRRSSLSYTGQVLSARRDKTVLVMDGCLTAAEGDLIYQLLLMGSPGAAAPLSRMALQDAMPACAGCIWESDSISGASPTLLADMPVVFVRQPLQDITRTVQQQLRLALSDCSTAGLAEARRAHNSGSSIAVERSPSDGGVVLFDTYTVQPGQTVPPCKLGVPEQTVLSLASLVLDMLHAYQYVIQKPEHDQQSADALASCRLLVLAEHITAVASTLWQSACSTISMHLTSHCNARSSSGTIQPGSSPQLQVLAVRIVLFASAWAMGSHCMPGQLEAVEQCLVNVAKGGGFAEQLPAKGLYRSRLCLDSGEWVPWCTAAAVAQRNMRLSAVNATAQAPEVGSDMLPKGEISSSRAGTLMVPPCKYDLLSWPSGGSCLFVHSERITALMYLTWYWLQAKLHPMLIGPPGCGKSTVSRFLMQQLAGGSQNSSQPPHPIYTAMASVGTSKQLWDTLMKQMERGRQHVRRPTVAGGLVVLIDDLHLPLTAQQPPYDGHAVAVYESLRQLLDDHSWASASNEGCHRYGRQRMKVINADCTPNSSRAIVQMQNSCKPCCHQGGSHASCAITQAFGVWCKVAGLIYRIPAPCMSGMSQFVVCNNNYCLSCLLQ